MKGRRPKIDVQSLPIEFTNDPPRPEQIPERDMEIFCRWLVQEFKKKKERERLALQAATDQA